MFKFSFTNLKKLVHDSDWYDKAFVIIFLFLCFFGYYGIGRAAVNNDAQFWYTRTQNFIDALEEGKLNLTYQNPKPGVTIMWVSGLSLETFLRLYEWKYNFRPDIYTYDTFPLTHFATIGPLVTIHLLGILVLYTVLSKISKKEIALLSVITFGFQPFVIGISRIFQADSTVASFMIISALLLIYSCYKDKKGWLMVFSGISAGLAILSKSSAVFLLPYAGFVFLVDFFFSRKKLLEYVKLGFIWLISLSITFFALFPAMWLKPLVILKRIFVDEGLYLVIEGRDGINGFLYYLEPIYRILTPLFLVSFVLGIIYVFVKYKENTKKEKQNIILVVGYVFFFILQMSIARQKMDRYLFPAIPFMGVIAGYGLFYISTLASKRINQKYFLVIWTIFNLAFLMYFFPYYLIFPSEKGKDQFGCSLCPEVGDYLNSKPNPSDLKIITLSKKVHRLKPYVKGKIYTTDEILPNGWTPEYVVAFRDETLPDQYKYCQLEQKIGFRGIDYWYLYGCK